MNLNKQQQTQWQLVSGIFTGLSAAINDEQILATQMKPHIDAFETLVGGKAKVKIRMTPTPTIAWVDCSSDSLKLSVNDKSMVMRACMNGIRFSTTLTYGEAYAHTNADLIDALETLKQSLLKLPSDMKDMQAGDLSALIGLAPSSTEDDEVGDEPPATAGEVVNPAPAALVAPAAVVAQAAAPDEESEIVMSFESDNSVPVEEVEIPA